MTNCSNRSSRSNSSSRGPQAVALTPTCKRARTSEPEFNVLNGLNDLNGLNTYEVLMIGSGTLTKQIASYLARTGYEALNDDALREEVPDVSVLTRLLTASHL
jgi:hypothetical protein